jgi:hypothetical protein
MNAVVRELEFSALGTISIQHKGHALDTNASDGSINIHLQDGHVMRSVRMNYIGCVTGYIPLWSR